MATSQSRRRVLPPGRGCAAAALVATIVTATVVGAAGMSAAEALRAFAGLLRHGTDATGISPSGPPPPPRYPHPPNSPSPRGRRCAVHRRRFVSGIFRNPLAEPYLSESPQVPAGSHHSDHLEALHLPAIYTYSLRFCWATLAAFLVYRVSTIGGHTSAASLLLSGWRSAPLSRDHVLSDGRHERDLHYRSCLG